MRCTEDQFRGILREEAADVRAETVPPLRLPAGSPARLRGAASRGRRWLVPLGAAAAVTAIAVAATVVADGSQAPQPDAAAPGLWHGVPAYYLLVTNDPQHRATVEAFVRDTRSGATVATAHSPGDCSFLAVSAAADDRTFVIECLLDPRKTHSQGDRLLLARFDPVTHRLSVTATRLPLVSPNSSVAISRDGTRIAVLSANVPSAGDGKAPKQTLSVYSIATGTVRTWSGSYFVYIDPAGSSGISWGPGPLLAFDYTKLADDSVYSVELPGSGIRLLDTNARSGSLLGASRPAVPTAHLPGGYQQVGEMAISGNGAIVATVLTARPGNLTGTEFAEFSLATGKLLRRWLPSADSDECVLWSDLTGKTLVAMGSTGQTWRDFGFGIMTGDRFTPLPLAGGIAGFAAAF